jgi:hypothetical protein
MSAVFPNSELHNMQRKVVLVFSQCKNLWASGIISVLAYFSLISDIITNTKYYLSIISNF